MVIATSPDVSGFYYSSIPLCIARHSQNDSPSLAFCSLPENPSVFIVPPRENIGVFPTPFPS